MSVSSKEAKYIQEILRNIGKHCPDICRVARDKFTVEDGR